MTGRRRRAALLLGLALLLGGLAASDVSRRQAAVDASLAPLVDVVVARGDLLPGARLTGRDLAVRRVPERYAPVGAAAEPAELVGRSVAVPVVAGGFLGSGQLADASSPGGAPVRRGERAAEVVGVGSAQTVTPGSRVDVLVTRGGEDRVGGATRLALEDVEVLAAQPARDGNAPDGEAGVPRVAATLRVTVRQAVYLAAAQSFARELRLLPRAAGDRRRAGAVAVGEGL